MLGSWRVRRWLAARRKRALTRAARAAVARFPVVATRRPHDLPAPLVVNLTSYPARFATLGATIRSLLDQHVAPDRTILWLAHDDIAALPDEVTALASHGLEVRGCDDTRSFKKLLPALATWPDSYHVTADDDVYYPPDWLSGLVEAVDPAMRTVVAWRAHLARRGADGMLLPYRDWEMATARTVADEPGTALFPTGVGGVLYPPGALAADVFDEARFRALCPRADDVWFYWMAHRAGTGHRRVAGWFELIEWPASQDVGLCVDNVDGDGNDRQIRAMEAVYGPFPI